MHETFFVTFFFILQITEPFLAVLFVTDVLICAVNVSVSFLVFYLIQLSKIKTIKFIQSFGNAWSISKVY